MTACTAPADRFPSFHLGTQYSDDSLQAKLLMNPKSFSTDAQVTYLLQNDLVIGGALSYDANNSTLSQYDFGLVWTPVANALVGLKHESLKPSLPLEFGRLKLYMHNYATKNQTIGSEFALDWQRRQLEARLGLLHKFDASTTGKIKVDHHGNVDAVIKHKISPSLAVGISSGLNVKSEVLESPRLRSFPFGISLDINF